MTYQTQIKNMSSLLNEKMTERRHVIVKIRKLDFEIVKQKQVLMDLKKKQLVEFNNHWSCEDCEDCYEDCEEYDDYDDYYTRKRMIKNIYKGVDTYSQCENKRGKEARAKKKHKRSNPEMYMFLPTQNQTGCDFMLEMCAKEEMCTKEDWIMKINDEVILLTHNW
jgi:hypothetical protein